MLEKEKELLTPQECDILGEIANISFGSASTVLSTILNRQVSITAPHVELVDLYDTSDVEVPHVVLNIHFTKGLDMENLLVLQQDVALSIADLMMMGTGKWKRERTWRIRAKCCTRSDEPNDGIRSDVYVGILPRYGRHVSANN